jgi:MFS family permease
MESKDLILLLHPVAAVILVFPLLGVVVNRALQVRQRRLTEGKSKIPATVGQEHVQLGRWLTGSVVGIVLLALANDVLGNIVQNGVWGKEPFKVVLIGLMFGAAIASLTLLYKAQSKLWRGTFATLSSMALIVLGAQDGVYRKTEQWYVSHYYYGIAAAVLMIISLTILREIYQDRTHRWRTVHIVLNSIALLLFIGQGITGTQSLLEVPLHWQEPYVQKLYEFQCNQKPCNVQPSVGSIDKSKN